MCGLDEERAPVPRARYVPEIGVAHAGRSFNERIENGSFANVILISVQIIKVSTQNTQ